MIVETRKTAQGTEYWDNVAKRTLFVPAGKEPEFEVTVNPKSMIVGVDVASGPDTTAVTIDLKDMTVAQLKEYAAAHDIEIPKDAKKDDIIKLLSDAE